MLKKLYPYEYTNSVFSIDYNKLYNKGYKGLIFDIDNTLVHHGADSTEGIDELFKTIHSLGFKTILLTNNCESRVKRFIKNIDTLYICEADKPKTTNYYKALEMLNIQKEEAVFIGDQIFTDIYGANKSGIASILVKYLRRDNETKIGKKRTLEKVILKFYQRNKKYQYRLGNINLKKGDVSKMKKKRKLFCDINPTCYKISLQKEIVRKHLKNILSKEKFAKKTEKEKLANVISSHKSNMIKRAKGVDITLQKNKAVNIRLACSKLNGIIIHPGETFSFWGLIGKPSKKNGYKDGRVIKYNQIVAGTGGGLCNLSNTIHLLVLHSPLDVTEFHKHSDALAPDKGKRVPFATGTSVSYNALDYRFKNNTDQKIQLCLKCKGESLYAELRSEKEFPWTYELIEEDHRFQKEGDKYYRNSKIYRNVRDRKTNKVINKELILNNHSEVMYDYDLIPQDQIRD